MLPIGNAESQLVHAMLAPWLNVMLVPWFRLPYLGSDFCFWAVVPVVRMLRHNPYPQGLFLLLFHR